MKELPLKIDLQKIVDERLPRGKRRMVPRVLIKWLERLVHQDELNDILETTFPKTGSAFARGALDYLDIKTEVRGLENIPADGRFIFASNHPLGGLDGIALISVLGERYGDERLRLPVNDMLMNVRPLRGVFIPINKFGRQGREAARQLNETYASEAQIVFFPAGLVSRLQKDGSISDLVWQKTFVAKAREYGRDIIPVHFSGLNSRRFYRVARWRKRLGLKFNFEQILLPGEVCKARGSNFKITFGKPIHCADLERMGTNSAEIAAEIRKISYSLA